MLSGSRSKHVQAHAKSIVMGGGIVLFPIDHTNLGGMAENIRKVIIEAENAAYVRGREDAQHSMRAALGIQV